MTLPDSLAGFRFTPPTSYNLDLAEIYDVDSLLECWETGGVLGVDGRIDTFRSDRPKNPFTKYSTTLISVEIITKLALCHCNVVPKIREYIDILIDVDVKHSKVRFWQAIEDVLTYLPEKKYLKLRTDKKERFEQSYCYAVNCLLEKQGFEAKEIIPEEDYIQIKCPNCCGTEAVYFDELFYFSCKMCEAKQIADSTGFDMFDHEKSYELEIKNSFGENVVVEEGEFAFACKLCRRACLVDSPSSPDFSQHIRNLRCHNCYGETIITWLAQESGVKVRFEANSVLMQQNQSGQMQKVSKDKVRPEKILERIMSD